MAALKYKVTLAHQEAVPPATLGLPLLRAALRLATTLAVAAAVLGRKDLR